MTQSGRPRFRIGQTRQAKYEDFLKKQEWDKADWLTVPDPSRTYWDGTTVPAVGAREFTVLPSGIAIPASAARGPVPIDLIQIFLTAEDVMDRRLGIYVAERAVQQVRRDRLLTQTARLLGLYEALQADHSDLDTRLTKGWFREPAATKVQVLLRGQRRLIAPQALMMLMRMALLHAPLEPEDEDAVQLPVLVLAIQDELGLVRSQADAAADADSAGSASSDESNVFTGDTSSALFREIVQNQAFHAEVDESTMLGRHHLHWVVYPERMRDHSQWQDLRSLFQRATGVPFQDFIAVGLALWAIAETKATNPIRREQLGLAIPDERIDATLQLMSRTPVEMREEIIRREAEFHSQWSFDAFGMYPVLRMDDGTLLVLSRRLLLQRLFTFMPMHDLRLGLRAEGEGGDKDGERAYHWFRAMCEADALESLRNIAPTAAGPRRFYGETDIKAAFGTHGKKNADIAVEYPDAWLVAEISTRHLTRESVSGGSAAALEKDLELGVLVKAAQLEGTINDLMADEARLTGYAPVPRRRYVPVLVITEGFPVNPMTTLAVEKRLADAGLLQDPRVGPLHIVDQEELNMIEAIVESGGPSLLQLLEGHEAGNLRNMSLKTWLLVERGLRPGRPKRIAAPYEKAWQPVLDSVRLAAVAVDDVSPQNDHE